MRRLIMWLVVVSVTVGFVAGCGAPAPEHPAPAKKATTAVPAK